MVNWSEFAARAPELAEAGTQLLEEHRLGYLATVRKNGHPRLHPIVPVRAEDGLYVAVNDQSPKRWDLQRDGRYALHAPLGKRDDEFVITGRAQRIHDEATRRSIVEAAGHVIDDSNWLFEFRIETCLQGYWVNVGKPDTYPVRQTWHMHRDG